MCLPPASMTSLPSGKVSSAPIVTNLPSAIATPPLTVSRGVTTQPFFMTKSTFIVSLLHSRRHAGVASICVEHPLNVVSVICLCQRQCEQQARLPRLQVVGGDEAAP